MVGQMNGTLTIAGPVELDNVAVKTVGGRSAMLCRADEGAKITGVNNIKLYTVQAKIINHTEGVSCEIEGIVGETVGTVTKVNAEPLKRANCN